MAIAKQRLYLTEDRTALVAEGDERGASLYAAPGDEIPESACELFGLVHGDLDLPKPKARTAKQQLAADQAEADRLAAEKAEADKSATEKAEADASATEKAQGN